MKNSVKKAPVLAAGFSGMVFFGVAFVIMGAVLPSLIQKFGLDTAIASMLAGLLPLGVLLGSVVFGPVIDRFGYKSLIIISSIITVAGLEILAWSDGIAIIRFSIFLIGLGGGILNGLTNALISDISDDHNRASNLSILGVFYTVGAITIPLLFATLSKSITYPPIIAGTGAIMMISVVFYFSVKFPEAKFKQGFPVKKIISIAKEPALLLLSFTLFFQSGLEGISNNWIPTWLNNEAGIESEKAMFALSSIIMGVGVGRLTLSILLKFISKKLLLLSSMFISASGIYLITLFPSVTVSIAGTFMMGLGFASTFPVIFSEIGEKYKELSGTAFSFALVIALTGNTLINLFVGVVSLKYFPILIIGCTFAISAIYIIQSTASKNRLTK
jgi:fucose permease